MIVAIQEEALKGQELLVLLNVILVDIVCFKEVVKELDLLVGSILLN
jgi:hypothetical protein